MDNLKRCPAPLAGSECGSAVFYDWGIQLFSEYTPRGISGQDIPRWEGFGQFDNVKICVRCTTPFVIEGGELVSIENELSAEDVKAILTRGQATNPHPKVKDP